MGLREAILEDVKKQGIEQGIEQGLEIGKEELLRQAVPELMQEGFSALQPSSICH